MVRIMWGARKLHRERREGSVGVGEPSVYGTSLAECEVPCMLQFLLMEVVYGASDR